MQFSEILTSVYDRTGNSATVIDTAVARRIKAYVNRWNRKILSAPLMEPLRRVTVPLASVAAQPTYGIVLKSIDYLSEWTTQRKLDKQTLGWYRTNYPDPSRFSGTPLFWIPLGEDRAHTRPSAACQLFIVSTSASDITQVVKIEAVRSTGYRVSLSATLTGTTPVTMGSAYTDIVDIVNVRMSVVGLGDVTVTQGSGGTELAKIPIGQTYPRYQRIALAPTPSQVITYQVDGIADIVDLTNDYDEPFFDADFHDLLVDGAVYDEWVNRGRSREAAALRAEIELRQRALRNSVLEWPTQQDTPQKTFDQTIHEPIA